MPVTGKIQIEGGDFQNAEGAPLANGYLIVQLSHDAQEVVDPGLITGMPKMKVALNSGGNIPSSPATDIWPNDQLLPGGTYYTVTGYAADGTYVFGPQYWVLTSATSPYNVANQEPTNPPGGGLIGVSPAVLLNPSGTQVISVGNLNPASGNTTQSLGQSGSEWDASLLNVVISGTLTDGTGSVGTSGQVLESTGTEAQWVNPTVISGVTVSGTPSSGEVLTATSSSTADWQALSSGLHAPIKNTTTVTQTGDTSVHTIYTIPIPGGAMPATGQMRITLTFYAQSNTGSVLEITYGGTNIAPPVGINSGLNNSDASVVIIGGNLGVTNSQSWDLLEAPGFIGHSSFSNILHNTSTTDSTVNQNLLVTFQGNMNSDSFTFYRCIVEFL